MDFYLVVNIYKISLRIIYYSRINVFILKFIIKTAIIKYKYVIKRNIPAIPYKRLNTCFC